MDKATQARVSNIIHWDLSLSLSLFLSYSLSPLTHNTALALLPTQRRLMQCSKEKPSQPLSPTTACRIPALGVHLNFQTGQHTTWATVLQSTSTLPLSQRQWEASDHRQGHSPQVATQIVSHQNGVLVAIQELDLVIMIRLIRNSLVFPGTIQDLTVATVFRHTLMGTRWLQTVQSTAI